MSDEPTFPPPITGAPPPKPRFGYDEHGDPIEAPATGLAMDPETGQAVIPPEAPPEPAPRASRAAPEKPPVSA